MKKTVVIIRGAKGNSSIAEKNNGNSRTITVNVRSPKEFVGQLERRPSIFEATKTRRCFIVLDPRRTMNILKELLGST